MYYSCLALELDRVSCQPYSPRSFNREEEPQKAIE